MEGRLILALLVCLALTEYGLGREIVTREINRCVKVCFDENAPVCGSDGKTYGNECQLNVADCESEEDIRKVHDGPCSVACPLIGCINPCRYGYFPDAKGCPTCKCKIIALLKELECGSIVQCTKDDVSVCGSDGRTYSDQCQLLIADCMSDEHITKVHGELCFIREIACGYLPTFCTMHYTPVCGSDGKTYVNDCQLILADCKSKEYIKKVHDGPCSR